MTSLKCAFLALLAIGSATSVSGATFFNGSFELPGDLGTTYLDAGNASFVTGWVHAGGTANSEFYTGSGGWDISAHDGANYVGFGANASTGGSLSQTFDTVIGAEYLVSYFLATQEFEGVPPDQTAQVEIFDAVNGGAAYANASHTFAPAAGLWFGEAFTFVAASTSTTIRFTDMTPAGPENDVNWALDSVNVATPEPASWLLLGLGAGLLGVIRKAR